ncbi:hypothetical protein L202_01369 [Cryptococcus amylolentus CBS 6039]|uniref:Uncharacterized protein n=1 Tax=Cryptococcus amylolentus CBS 6039 TaxID=1295533 RepID=A0A1E3I3P6_9TREE|nr:hypothetical protein L202_01369 [Cryptococcus amylolentus CBS 6039]ODN83179.1 hypothetical protein L202_01369 [Cryptococcus amylolentus CBS 6039]
MIAPIPKSRGGSNKGPGLQALLFRRLSHSTGLSVGLESVYCCHGFQGMIVSLRGSWRGEGSKMHNHTVSCSWKPYSFGGRVEGGATNAPKQRQGLRFRLRCEDWCR